MKTIKAKVLKVGAGVIGAVPVIGSAVAYTKRHNASDLSPAITDNIVEFADTSYDYSSLYVLAVLVIAMVGTYKYATR